MKIPPRVQMWIGAVGSLLFLLRVIVTITNPMATADWIEAYSAFCAASLFAGMAWRGYQRRPKQGDPAKSETLAAKPHLTGE